MLRESERDKDGVFCQSGDSFYRIKYNKAYFVNSFKK